MAFIIQNLDDYLKILKELVNIDSQTSDPEGVNKVANTLIPYFKELNLYTKLQDFGPKVGNGLFVTNAPLAQEYDLFLCGHLDTVFEKGTAKARPFRVENNLAYGPGVSDMKDGDVAILWFFKKISDLNLDIKVAVCFCPDEEVGSQYSYEWIDSIAKKAKYALVLEGNEDENIFVDRRKGISYIDVYFKGRGAHAGFCPEQGRSAINALANFIIRVNKLAFDDLTVNVGVVDGGTVANIIPENAHARLDIRFFRQSSFEKFIKNFEEELTIPFGEDISVSHKVFLLIKPMEPSENTQKLRDITQKAALELGLSPRFESSGGVSDGNHISSYIPVLDNFGPRGGAAHTDREWLDITSIEPRVDLLVKIAKEIVIRP